jgi:hypothetical protein
VWGTTRHFGEEASQTGPESCEKPSLEFRGGVIGGSAFAMFRLDYFSCILTIVATVLVARKSWTGLVVSSMNCLIVCEIGLRTSQFGFIPANLFCICMYVFSIRSWIKNKRNHGDQAQQTTNGPISAGPRMSATTEHRTGTLIQFPTRP